MNRELRFTRSAEVEKGRKVPVLTIVALTPHP
jgi:hypothetical protein